MEFNNNFLNSRNPLYIKNIQKMEWIKKEQGNLNLIIIENRKNYEKISNELEKY
jgi:hypothetical protein